MADNGERCSNCGTENPVGQDELRAFLTRLFAQPQTIDWEGDDLTVGEHGGVVWFLLVGTAVPGEDWSPHRLSGVLVPHGGRHRLAQLHGSHPAADRLDGRMDQPVDGPVVLGDGE